MPSLATRTPAPTVISDDVDLPPRVPPLPDDLYVRFPSLRQWQEDEDAWWARTYQAVQGSNRWVSQTVTQVNQSTGDLRVSFNEFTAAITTEVEAIATEQEAQARRIVTVSAMAGVSQNIKVQGTPPAGPVLNNIWIDNSDLSLPITYKWNGVAWAEVTTPITAAAVSDERTARVTADGFLAGKYTLTVIAGNVVTGMNITSSTGGGSDISSVIFRATDFQIYNGVTGITMFEVSGSTVNLAGTLTVSTSGKVFIGTGTYGNANTAWYVDSAGKFSLKDKLTWDGTTLAITGAITATTGSIGGFDIGSDYIRDSLNSMGLASTVTGGDDVRFWAGDTFANRATAPFRITEAGTLVASSATITGSVNCGAGQLNAANCTFTTYSGLLTLALGTNLMNQDVQIIFFTDTTAPDSRGNARIIRSPGRTSDFFLQNFGGGSMVFELYDNAGTGNGSFSLQPDGIHLSGGTYGWGDFTTHSSRTLKENIVPVKEALAKMRKLAPVYFDWKKNVDSALKGEHDVGLIAEDVESLWPELVVYDKDRVPGIKYGKLSVLLIAALNELAEACGH